MKEKFEPVLEEIEKLSKFLESGIHDDVNLAEDVPGLIDHAGVKLHGIYQDGGGDDLKEVKPKK